ncbi:MAG TPA: hypothetical protein PKE21_17365 [Flavobacteriales bacterium]|nr:hypothetical protein [Flavobacteriales bacterium]HMR29250.1 hypothetical protein [Flavobacteriales bacterium]
MKLWTLLVGATLSTQAVAQAGAVDLSFNPADAGHGFGDGPNLTVSAVLPLPGGGAVIAGNFTLVDGVARNGIARLLADGSIDPAFDPGAGIPFSIYGRKLLRLQPDGKILVAGLFTAVDGTPRNRIARLHPDGSLDTSFDPGAGLDGEPRDMELQPDGKVLVMGDFTSYAGEARAGLVRIQPDGSLDTDFTLGSGFQQLQWISARGGLDVRPDGRILVGGSFAGYGGHASPNLVQLLSTGAPDLSFVASTGGQRIDHLLLLPDGKVLVNGIRRLNSNGSHDPVFSVGAGFTAMYGPTSMREMVRQADGHLVAVGCFDTFNGTTRRGIVRLMPDGALDSSFDPGLPIVAYSCLEAVALQSDGRIWAGGEIPALTGTGRKCLTRLMPDGSPDPGYNPGTGLIGEVRCMVQRPDGRLVVGGSFTNINGMPSPNLVALLPNGTVDPSFPVGLGTNDGVVCLALQPDGKVLVGGYFDTYQGQPAARLLRLNSDGSLDSGFDAGLAGYQGVAAVAVQPDGRILVSRSHGNLPMVRLMPDGSADPGFIGPARTALAMLVQPDGRILLGGFGVGGSYDRALTRLNADGTPDPGFAPPSPAFGAALMASPIVTALHLEVDGHILAGGSFTRFNNVPRLGLLRLLPDGTLDPGFVPATTNWVVSAMLVQADGRIVVANGSTVQRLLPTGALDPGFVPSMFTMPGGSLDPSGNPVRALLLRPDGRVVVGGIFTGVNGTGRNRLARLLGDGTAGVRLALRAGLGGAHEALTDLHRDDLRQQGLLPLGEPYSVLGYAHTGGGGGELTTAGVLAVTGDRAVVDWVVAELRDPGAPQQVVASRSALLLRDGSVVDLDGSSPVHFAAASGTYHVGLHHRNHLGVMTAAALLLGTEPVALDLRAATTATYGTGARRPCGTWQCLWPGDVTRDDLVKYAGNANDRDPILSAVGGVVPTAVLGGVYLHADVNLDGTVKYTGVGNDRDVVLQTIGGPVPTAVRQAQLP